MENILGLKTYGKQNFIQREIINLNNIFRVNHLLESYTNLKFYKPKFSKIRIGFGVVGVIGCLVTPATNFAIPFIARWSLK